MNHSFKFLILFLSFFHLVEAADWKPVDPADLGLKAPRVDAAAARRSSFWEEWISDAAANNQYP